MPSLIIGLQEWETLDGQKDGWMIYITNKPAVATNEAKNGWDLLANDPNNPTSSVITYPINADPIQYIAEAYVKISTTQYKKFLGFITIPYPPLPITKACKQGTAEELEQAGFTIISGPYDTEEECAPNCAA